MTRFAPIALVAAAGLAAPGCFYTDPVNQRPSLDIRQTSAEVVVRDSTVTLEAVSNDPEGHFVFFHWRAYLATDEGNWDEAPFYEKSGSEGDRMAEFYVPRTRNDDSSLPVQAIRVVLQGQDAFGANARPDQQLWIPVADRAPTLELRKDSRYGYVDDTPINRYAKVGDEDDWPAVPELAWEVFTPPNQPGYKLRDIEVMQDGGDDHHLQFGKEFTPKNINN